MVIDLSEVLTEDEIKSLPFSKADFDATEEFVSLIKEAGNEDIFIGIGDSFFTDLEFVFLTRLEMDEYAELWAKDVDENLEDVKTQIYDAVVKVDPKIIRKILKAIK